MTAHIVGIGGLLASGKDTVADYLVEKHGWVKMGMSDPLWDALKVLNPYIPVQGGLLPMPLSDMLEVIDTIDQSDDDQYVKAKKNKEVRRLLQVLGTEIGRDMIGANTWTDIAKRKATAAHSMGQNVILTGIRFPNEATMVSEIGGELWWVDRPTLINVDESAKHASENSINSQLFNRVISNNGTLEDLYREVDKALA